METVNEFKEHMENSLSEAKAALAKAKDDNAKYYKCKREPAPVFQPGDKVYLDASHIQTAHPSKKLSHQNLGPYTVKSAKGSHAYHVKLPHSMSCLHPVFPVVKLTPKPVDPFPGRHPKKPPDPILVDEEEEYFVEKILDSRLRSGKLDFLVKWEEYGYEENQWVPEDNVHALELVC